MKMKPEQVLIIGHIGHGKIALLEKAVEMGIEVISGDELKQPTSERFPITNHIFDLPMIESLIETDYGAHFMSKRAIRRKAERDAKKKRKKSK